MSEPASGKSSGESAAPNGLIAPPVAYAARALSLSGIDLSAADLDLTVAEFERAQEIVQPLLDFALADGLDQAGIYRP